VRRCRCCDAHSSRVLIPLTRTGAGLGGYRPWGATELADGFSPQHSTVPLERSAQTWLYPALTETALSMPLILAAGMIRPTGIEPAVPLPSVLAGCPRPST